MRSAVTSYQACLKAKTSGSTPDGKRMWIDRRYLGRPRRYDEPSEGSQPDQCIKVGTYHRTLHQGAIRPLVVEYGEIWGSSDYARAGRCINEI